MKNKILLISTYKELTEMARKIAKELGVGIDIYDGGIMKNGHLYAKENQNKYDVIISSGGTAEGIKQIVSKPVVSVEISTIDLLSIIYEAQKYNDKIVMVVYKNDNIYDLCKLKNYLNVDFEVFSYKSKEELVEKINVAISSGKITLISMGECIADIAKSKELNYLVIKSGENHVRDALIAAINICQLSRGDKEIAERFRVIIDNSGEGIISFDSSCLITTFNKAAERILEVSGENIINKNIVHIKNDNFKLLYGDGKLQLNKLMKINDTQVLVNRIPVVIDNDILSVVITFQEATKIQKMEQKVRTELYKKGLVAKYTFDDIIGESDEIKNTINKAKKIGKTNSTILITAETGSGKELFAQSIHNISSRRDGPFVAINCAALPENLLESELFGYEEGAFTGAKKGGKIGLFELSHGGTIFLDEISEIPIGLQGRLLRVLQEREILRIGSDYVTNVDIRIIAATNINLYEKVMEGKFREDLFFRISVLDLYIPSLRERKEDIELLLQHFLNEMGNKLNLSNIKPEAMKWLKDYCWPGNIRELENFAQKMNILLEDYDVVDKKNLVDISNKKMQYNSLKGENRISVVVGELRDMENQIIRETVRNYKGDKAVLADQLGISRTTLWKKLKEIEEIEESE